MAFKSLLVHLDDTQACAARIDLAIAIARAHGAFLTGLYVAGDISMPGFIEQQISEEALAEIRRAMSEWAEDPVADFREKTQKAGLSFDCRVDHGREADIPSIVAAHARYADLVVLGQVNPERLPLGGRHLPEHVALDCGRPVLMVPYTSAATRVGEHVMIAWNGGREATRAVNDALPILEKAKSVSVLTVNPPVPAGYDREQSAGLGLHLARYGIKVEVQQVEAGVVSIADTILSRLSDNKADLLVMGAYGHWRLRELVLGGVTQHVLRHTVVPVLMSH
jgi:nucleotide-binding universal stress UspA family protein